MASTIKVDKIEGSTGSTVTIPTGQTLTVTDGLAIGSLPTITVAKGGTNIASFTAGDILYATGATTLAKLAKGTAAQVLAMNSGATAPEWTAGGGGAWNFVSRAAIGGSNVGSVVFTNLSTSGESYMFVWNGIDSTADSNEDFQIHISTDNGSAYRTSGYKSAIHQWYSDGGSGNYGMTNGFSLSENQSSSDVSEGNNGWVILHNLSATLKTAYTGQSVTMGDSNRVRMNSFGGFYDTAEDTDAVRFTFESGNITASTVGYISCYKQVIA